MDYLELTIDGKTVRMGRLGMGMMLKSEERLQQVRRDLAKRQLAESSELGDTALHYYMANWCQVLRSIVPITEIAEWLLSPGGMAFSFWQSMLVHQPGMTEAESLGLFDKCGLDQFRQFEDWLQAELLKLQLGVANETESAE